MRTAADEKLYRSNIEWDMIKELIPLARWKGVQAKEDIERCMKHDDPEMQHFYAYFAGSNARAAFTVAQRILDMEAGRDDNRVPFTAWSRL